jgi:hypothetical protein
MTLQDVTSVFHIVAAIALVVSAVLLYLELRENNRLARASNTQSLVRLSAPFITAMIQDRKMAEFYVHGAKASDEMDPVDQHRYRSLVTWWLVFHENAYYQWRRGLLDDHSYKPWGVDLTVFIDSQNLASQWETLRHLFQDEFAEHVDNQIARCRITPNPDHRPEATTDQLRPGVEQGRHFANTP